MYTPLEILVGTRGGDLNKAEERHGYCQSQRPGRDAVRLHDVTGQDRQQAPGKCKPPIRVKPPLKPLQVVSENKEALQEGHGQQKGCVSNDVIDTDGV